MFHVAMALVIKPMNNVQLLIRQKAEATCLVERNLERVAWFVFLPSFQPTPPTQPTPLMFRTVKPVCNDHPHNKIYYL